MSDVVIDIMRIQKESVKSELETAMENRRLALTKGQARLNVP